MQRFPTVRMTDFLFPSQSLWTVPAEESEMDGGTNLICICSITVSRGQKGLCALDLRSLYMTYNKKKKTTNNTTLTWTAKFILVQPKIKK